MMPRTGGSSWLLLHAEDPPRLLAQCSSETQPWPGSATTSSAINTNSAIRSAATIAIMFPRDRAHKTLSTSNKVIRVSSVTFPIPP